MLKRKIKIVNKGLIYGLKNFTIGDTIHVVINGYSYKASILSQDENSIEALVIQTNEIKRVLKTQTFR